MFDNYKGSSGTDAGSDNECMTYEGKAYDVDALKYENGHYYFRVADTGDWKLLRWTAYTGHGAYPDNRASAYLLLYDSICKGR